MLKQVYFLAAAAGGWGQLHFLTAQCMLEVENAFRTLLMIAELELTAQLTAQRPRALLYFSSETESLPPAEWSHTLFKFSVLRRQ